MTTKLWLIALLIVPVYAHALLVCAPGNTLPVDDKCPDGSTPFRQKTIPKTEPSNVTIGTGPPGTSLHTPSLDPDMTVPKMGSGNSGNSHLEVPYKLPKESRGRSFDK